MSEKFAFGFYFNNLLQLCASKKARRRSGVVAALLVTALLPETRALAAPTTTITWGTPTNISGDSDVSNSGTLLGAFSLGTSSTGATVNGVTFAPLDFANDAGGGSVSSGNFSVNVNSLRHSTNTGYGSASSPFTGLSTAYQTLLASGATSYSAGQNMAVVMSNLNIGQAYTFEFWSNASSNATFPYGSVSAVGPAGSSVTLSNNTSSTAGALGQYVIGTFTAATTSVYVDYSSVTAPEAVNAFELTTTAPEPGSLSLLGFGAAAPLLRRKTRSA